MYLGMKKILEILFNFSILIYIVNLLDNVKFLEKIQEIFEILTPKTVKSNLTFFC